MKILQSEFLKTVSFNFIVELMFLHIIAYYPLVVKNLKKSQNSASGFPGDERVLESVKIPECFVKVMKYFCV